jgi:hypothetical protein
MRGVLLRRKKFWLLCGTIAALIVLGSAITAKIRPEEASASSVKTVNITHGPALTDTHQFYIDGNEGWCVTANKATPYGTYTADVYTLDELRSGRSASGQDISNVQRMFIAYYYVKQTRSDLYWNTEAMHWGLNNLNFGYGRNTGSYAAQVYDMADNPFPENLESAEVTLSRWTGTSKWSSDGYQSIFAARYSIAQQGAIEVQKEWAEDDEWKDITRPDSVNFNVLQDGNVYRTNIVVSAANNWKETVDGLPSGHDYTVMEVTSTVTRGYMPSESGTIVTNTLMKTSKKVKKIWSGTPSDSAKICLNMRANDQYQETDKCLTLTATGEWNGAFSDLPIYDKNGDEIEYSVREVDYDSARYTPKYSVDSDGAFVIENSERAKLKVVKVWNDNNNQLSARPSAITVNILRNGQQFDTITLSSADQVSDNRWEKETPEYDVADTNGRRYVYTVSEEVTTLCNGLTSDALAVCQEYSPSYSQFEQGTTAQITNSLDGSTDVYVVKEWRDDSNVQGDRPTRITIDIYADGRLYDAKIICRFNCADVDNGSNVDTDTAVTDDTWSLHIWDLPKYTNEGKLIEYTVDERLSDVDMYRYTKTVQNRDVDGDHDNEFLIENTREYSVSITVEKEWIDNDNAYGTRPTISVWFRVMRSFKGGEPEFVKYIRVWRQGDSDVWTGTITGLPKYNNAAPAEDSDVPYVYSIIEDDEDFEWNQYYRNNGCELTDSAGTSNDYTHYTYTCVNELSGEVHLTGTKLWFDNNNEYNTRPESWQDFELKLFRRLDGEDHDTEMTDISPSWTVWPVYIDGDGNSYDDVWQYDYEFLPEYVDGKKATYRVTEMMPPVGSSGYRYCSVESPLADDDPSTSDYANRLCGWVTFTGKKVWRYGTIPENMKPEEITVYLSRNGQVIDSTRVTAAHSGESDDGTVEWYFGFGYYPMFDNEGRLYEYEFDEAAVENFVLSRQETNTLINTYVIDVTVDKIWLNDDPSKRPGKIDVTLYRDGVAFDTVVLNNDNNWAYTWKDLDSNYTYTVTEDIQIPGYAQGEYTYTYDDEGNLVIDIYNAGDPNPLDKGISRYVWIVSGVLLSGFVISRTFLARRL